MNLTDAINGRKSIRGYLPKPVDRETMEKVLNLASRAVSGVNAQPWRFVVVTGEKLDQLRQENIRCLLSGAPTDGKNVGNVNGVYDTRRREVGKQLFAAMGIQRGDRMARMEWSMRGYRFFDAPAAIFLCMDKQLEEEIYSLDIGCVVQNLCLAAMEYGLGTCVETQAVMFHEPLRRILEIPNDQNIITGIAIGYPDDSFPANSVVTSRAPLEENTTWIGFE